MAYVRLNNAQAANQLGSLGAITETTISKELDAKNTEIDGAILNLWKVLWGDAAEIFNVTGRVTRAGKLYSGPGTAFEPSSNPDVAIGDLVVVEKSGGGWYEVTSVNGDILRSGWIASSDAGSRFNASTFKTVFENKLSAAIQIEIQESALKAEPISDVSGFRAGVKTRLETTMCEVKSIEAMGIC